MLKNVTPWFRSTSEETSSAAASLRNRRAREDAARNSLKSPSLFSAWWHPARFLLAWAARCLRIGLTTAP
jgi:hypothetical protein